MFPETNFNHIVSHTGVVMVSNVFLFVGIVLLGTGILSYFSFSGNSAFIPLGILGGIGLLFTFLGLTGRNRDSKQAKLNLFITQTGVETEGIVLFVDKNYYILLNKKPIYSIVEYKYSDSNGTEHIRKVDNIPSDLVIRNKIEVGGTVKIKYLKEDPKQSVILIFPT
jgi:hypothetical protein